MIRGLGAYGPAGALAEFDVDAPGGLAAALPEAVGCARAHAGGFAWVGLADPSHAELELVARQFSLPALLVEDAANPRQRAKVERLGHDLGFVLLKQLGYREETSDVETGQVAVITGPGFAVTIRLGQVGELGNVRHRIAASPELGSLGSLAVLYAVMDAVVDAYVAVSDEVSADIEELETEVFSERRSADLVTRLYRLKRENIEVRRAVAPLAGFAHEAIRGSDALPPASLPYFRDVADHLLRAQDQVEQADALITGLVMATTAQQDLQQNRDMRKISAWVAIAAVPTMVAAVYGMNFRHMPELDWPWAYPAVLAGMAAACGLLYRAFRRSGWL